MEVEGVDVVGLLTVELDGLLTVELDGLLTVELDGLLTVVELEGLLTVVELEGLLTVVELDGLLEVEEPLDWLGDTVYTAEGFGRLLELELELEGLLVDDGRTADGELIPLDGFP